MREMVKALRPILGTVAACRHVGISRASYNRSQRAAQQQPKRRRQSRRRLSEARRAEIRAILNAKRFVDLPPRQIWWNALYPGTSAILADPSIRTNSIESSVGNAPEYACAPPTNMQRSWLSP